MPAITKEPRAPLAGVQKAPRHEVAGSWVTAEQRALWGLMPAPLSLVSASRARGDVQCLPGSRRECSGYLGGRVKCSNGAAGELIDGVLLREAATQQVVVFGV